MSKIVEHVINDIPNIGDSIVSINGDTIKFDNGKTFQMDGSKVNIGDIIIRAFFELDKSNKELYVWIELSSGTSAYDNKWSAVVRHERRLKLERILK